MDSISVCEIGYSVHTTCGRERPTCECHTTDFDSPPLQPKPTVCSGSWRASNESGLRCRQKFGLVLPTLPDHTRRPLSKNTKKTGETQRLHAELQVCIHSPVLVTTCSSFPTANRGGLYP